MRTVQNLPALLVRFPLGFELALETETAQRSEFYYGANFAPGNYLRRGGVVAFIGYLLCLGVSCGIALASLLRADLSRHEKIVFTSILVLLPFAVQRTVIWDTALFAFLLAPSLLRVLGSPGRSGRIDG